MAGDRGKGSVGGKGDAGAVSLGRLKGMTAAVCGKCGNATGLPRGNLTLDVDATRLASAPKCHRCGGDTRLLRAMLLLSYEGIADKRDAMQVDEIIRDMEEKPLCWDCYVDLDKIVAGLEGKPLCWECYVGLLEELYGYYAAKRA